MSDGLFGSFFGPIFGNNQRTDVTTVKTVHEIVQRDDAEILHLRAENEKLRSALKPFADDLEQCAFYGYCGDNEWIVPAKHIYAAAAAIMEQSDE